MVLLIYDMPKWWNWQTRRTQNPEVAIPCGFDSRLRHHKKHFRFNLKCFLFYINNTFLIINNHIFHYTTDLRCYKVCFIELIFISPAALAHGYFCLIKSNSLPSFIKHMVPLIKNPVPWP